MEKTDKQFWRITKEFGGVSCARSGAAPSAEALVDHFAAKMTNGKDIEDEDFTPVDSLTSFPINNFKIRFKKVLSVLKSIVNSKSANGVSPVFWKDTADTIVPAVCKLFKLIIRDAS